ncbi:MAG: alpha/beta hydrolase [bacterium]|nr:alpha/beta hydrolase [bacterium]
MSTDQAEQVILVHGTFASSDSDSGQAWWQIGSQPYRELQRRLPRGVQLAAEGRVFHWSGHNHERARSKAARRLLDFIQPLEDSGTPYHLVGHSHGGSVIWAALRMATLRNKPLKQLNSWSTVGTPFLQAQSRSPLGIVNICYALMAACLLVPAARVFLFLIQLPYQLAVGSLQQGLIIQSDAEVSPLTAILRAPILKCLQLAGVPLTKVADGIRIGSYDPDSGQSLTTFLFGSLEGWLIFAAILMFGYLSTLLLSWCVGPVSEVIRIAWEKRLEQRAFDTYGDRWLGIWTPQDEAINGLRKTLEISVSFIGSLTQRERIFISDFLSLPSLPLLYCAAPFYNRLVRPVLDSMIRNLVVKAAQGNNRPATEIVAVSPHPTEKEPGPAAPPLPEWLCQKILQEADFRAKDLGPKLREFLGQPFLNAGLEQFSASLTGSELVHTSYFDHPEVIDLLALHISHCQHHNQVRRRSSFSRVTEWYDQLKAQHTPARITYPAAESRPMAKPKSAESDRRAA